MCRICVKFNHIKLLELKSPFIILESSFVKLCAINCPWLYSRNYFTVFFSLDLTCHYVPNAIPTLAGWLICHSPPCCVSIFLCLFQLVSLLSMPVFNCYHLVKLYPPSVCRSSIAPTGKEPFLTLQQGEQSLSNFERL